MIRSLALMALLLAPATGWAQQNNMDGPGHLGIITSACITAQGRYGQWAMPKGYSVSSSSGSFSPMPICEPVGAVEGIVSVPNTVACYDEHGIWVESGSTCHTDPRLRK